jgi:hypothetical protein
MAQQPEDVRLHVRRLALRALQRHRDPLRRGRVVLRLIDLSYSTFTNTSIDGFDEFFRAHEVAHQWWGNGARPASYRDAWLSEGLATFCGIWYVQLEMAPRRRA